FEQAIAEKCDTYISSHKNVVTKEEVEKIINDMGPVHTDDTQEPAGANASAKEIPSKRLYQIREGAWISGVCNGLAAYFNIDVTIVRVIFIIFTLANGIGILIYIIMMLVIPVARTNEERAMARGERFNARDFFESLRQKYGK